MGPSSLTEISEFWMALKSTAIPKASLPRGGGVRIPAFHNTPVLHLGKIPYRRPKCTKWAGLSRQGVSKSDWKNLKQILKMLLGDSNSRLRKCKGESMYMWVHSTACTMVTSLTPPSNRSRPFMPQEGLCKCSAGSKKLRSVCHYLRHSPDKQQRPFNGLVLTGENQRALHQLPSQEEN